MAEQVEFFDVKSKGKFKTDDYKIVDKGGRFFAVAKSKSGPHECWRVVSKDFAGKCGKKIEKQAVKKK
ncbi:hypothetical protein COV18_05935 [Candidatus Woesearchaeota archaeon CG10_big_fil_rev_8_21_14_0_10_37_12]|nr:MAG: hypothetical protein COV18_05935 [Candidatus Woesearchaeota archaeon CG10_big_fil_rev_8_21_14_0_10_37_12]